MRLWGRIATAVAVGTLARSLQRALSIIAVALVAPLLGVIIALLPAILWIPVAEHRLDDAWAEAIAPLTSVGELEPPREANPAAAELEAVAARLGIDLAVVGDTGRARPTTGAADRFATVLPQLEALTAALVSGPPAIPVLPEPLSSFLVAHGDDLAAALAVLGRDATPRWPVDLALGDRAPLPNFVGHMQLHGVLVAAALDRHHGGDPAAANAYLTASWQLVDTALRRPEREALVAALQPLTLLLAAVETVAPAPGPWNERLAGLDLQTRYRETLASEAWQGLQATRDSRLLTTRRGWLAVAARPLIRPFERIAMYDHARALRTAAVELPLADLTTFQPSHFEAQLRRGMPRWNHAAAVALAPLAEGWLVTTRAALDVELSAALLSARSLEQARDWRALAELRGSRPALARGFTWHDDVTLERLSIRLDGEPLPAPPPGLLLPPLAAELVFMLPLDAMKLATQPEETDPDEV